MHSRSLTGALRRARRHLLHRTAPALAAPAVAVLTLAVLTAGAAPAAATVTSPAAAGPACAVAYTVNSDWGTGFSIGITITNNGPAISSWTLQYSYTGNQKLQGGWSGTWSQSGENITVASASWNGSLATGASTSTGANFSYTGSNAPPAAFTLNGVSCTGTGGSGPSVAISSVSPPNFVNNPGSVTLQATASAGNAGTVTSVSYYATFFHNPSQVAATIGSAATPPYTVTWTAPPVQNYYLWATVTTSTGATATSSPGIQYTVELNGTPPP